MEVGVAIKIGSRKGPAWAGENWRWGAMLAEKAILCIVRRPSRAVLCTQEVERTLTMAVRRRSGSTTTTRRGRANVPDVANEDPAAQRRSATALLAVPSRFLPDVWVTRVCDCVLFRLSWAALGGQRIFFNEGDSQRSGIQLQQRAAKIGLMATERSWVKMPKWTAAACIGCYEMSGVAILAACHGSVAGVQSRRLHRYPEAPASKTARPRDHLCQPERLADTHPPFQMHATEIGDPRTAGWATYAAFQPTKHYCSKVPMQQRAAGQ